MESPSTGNWIQIVGTIGVVAGLLLVGVQLNQNSTLLKTQLLYEESKRTQDIEALLVGDNAADVWAKSISDPGNLSLAEQRVMEAILWSFVEQLRGTRMLAELGLLEDEEWRLRVESETVFFFGNHYGSAWWKNFTGSNSGLPTDLVTAINQRLAAVDNNFTADYTRDIIESVRESQGNDKSVPD